MKLKKRDVEAYIKNKNIKRASQKQRIRKFAAEVNQYIQILKSIDMQTLVKKRTRLKKSKKKSIKQKQLMSRAPWFFQSSDTQEKSQQQIIMNENLVQKNKVKQQQSQRNMLTETQYLFHGPYDDQDQYQL